MQGGDFEVEDGEPDVRPNEGDESNQEELLDEVQDDEPFPLQWTRSDPDPSNFQSSIRQTNPTQQILAGGSLTLPLVPNCLALVFKQTNCAVHSLVDNSYCRNCASRLVGICPNCSPNGANNSSKFIAYHQQHHLNAAIDSDFGFRLFKSFLDTNRRCLFWHRDLARCLRRLEYVGFIQPCTLLVTTAGGDDWLEVLKRCWSQQLLQSPPSYAMEMLAEVQGCQMQSICQSSAVNLIDAICGVICDVAFTSLPSTLDVIYATVVNKYSACGADMPPVEIFSDMLSFLVAKRRVVLSPNGCYRMASKESFAHHNHHGHHGGHHRSHQKHHMQVFDQNQHRPQPPATNAVANKEQHVSIFRRLFKRRFFGRAKSRESTPPPQMFAADQPQTLSPPPPSTKSTQLPPTLQIVGHPLPPLHSMNSLPYRGAVQPTRTPGLFNCYATGAVPSMSCSTNGSITRSRHGHHYRSNPLRKWPPPHQRNPIATSNKLNSSTGTTSNHDESLVGLSAPFSTPTSAYLSSSVNNFVAPEPQQTPVMCDEGYEGGLASGCADIQVEDGIEVAAEVVGVEQGELLENRSITSSASSSSWSSSVAKNETSSNKKNDQKNEALVENKDTLNATCAQIVSAELDSLIERYRLIGTNSSGEYDNNNETPFQDGTSSTANLVECQSRASTGTLFSIGDYIVYSAGLMVEPGLEDPSVGKLISVPTVEQFAADETMTANTTVITIDDEDDPGDVSGLTGPGAVLKVDAGQAIFGA